MRVSETKAGVKTPQRQTPPALVPLMSFSCRIRKNPGRGHSPEEQRRSPRTPAHLPRWAKVTCDRVNLTPSFYEKFLVAEREDRMSPVYVIHYLFQVNRFLKLV